MLMRLPELALVTNHYCDHIEVRQHELTEITARILLGLNSNCLANLGNRSRLIM